jgi:hypothetical protein
VLQSYVVVTTNEFKRINVFIRRWKGQKACAFDCAGIVEKLSFRIADLALLISTKPEQCIGYDDDSFIPFQSTSQKPAGPVLFPLVEKG